MALAETARLAVQIDLTGNLDRGITKSTQAVKGLDRTAAQTGKSVKAASTSGAQGIRSIGKAASDTGKTVKAASSASAQGMQSIGKAASTASKNLADTEKGVGRLGRAFKGLKGSIAAGFGIGAGLVLFNLLAQGIQLVINGMKDAQIAASDLAEQQDKVGLVFRSSADDVREWADTAAFSMGLSSRAALEAAGTFGNFLQAMNLTEEQSAAMSTELVQLSSDLASFNNTAGGSEEVLEAIAAGLRGETEPMMRFGVVLLETNVKAKALEMGLVSGTQALTDQQKVLARHALIMEKTRTAQGNFALTAGSSANQARIFDAAMESAQAKVGRFADAATKLVQQGLIQLVEALSEAADHFHTLERIASPHLALQEDITNAVIKEVEARGQSTEGIKEYIRQQQFLADQAKVAAESQERLIFLEQELTRVRAIQDDKGRSAIIDNAIAAIEAERDALLGLTDAAEDSAEALALSSENQQIYNQYLSGFLALSPEARADLIRLEDATSGVGTETKKTAQATRTLAQDNFDAATAAAAAERGYGKQRNSLRALIRSTRALKRENDETLPRAKKLLDQLAEAQRKQTQAAIDGRPDIVASYQAQINKIEDMLGPLRAAVTLSVRLATQAAIMPALSQLQAGFGNLGTGKLSGKNRGPNHMGGVLFPGDFGTMGERGPEKVRNVGGVTIIEPMQQKRERMSVAVMNVISAYETGKGISRVNATNRMRHNAL